jgi:endonuclease-3
LLSHFSRVEFGKKCGLTLAARRYPVNAIGSRFQALDGVASAAHDRRMTTRQPRPCKPRWPLGKIRDLKQRLNAFRSTCRVTTLTEVQSSRRSPFHLLVSCIISLRTKDEVTHDASGRLYQLANTPAELAALEEETIAGAIYPAGFYNTKAGQLRKIGAILLNDHGGEVPADEARLLELPGVGRKTANLVLGLGFGIPAICVDTHVHRISNRLGLVKTGNPDATEKALQPVLPEDLWIEINDLLVTFGQNRCHPTSPKCTDCPLDDLCPKIDVTRHR